MNIFKKPYLFAVIYSIFLIFLSVFILLDVFIIPREVQAGQEGFITADETFSFLEKPSGENTETVSEQNTQTSSSDEDITSEDTDKEEEEETTTAVDTSPSVTYPVITDTSYEDEKIKITLTTLRLHDTQVYVADVILNSAEYFKTAIAKDKFGTNIREKTSVMAKNNNAILAINGDYYGADKKGYVIKNGVLYRSSVRSDYKFEDLAVMYDRSFQSVNEKEISANELLNSGVYQLFAFGPFLVENSTVTVGLNDEVGQALASNPRTAIGIIDDLHYVFVVSDGRTDESKGLSLYELGTFMKEYGCTTAYNLDGGGSSTMYFNGKIINNPVHIGNKTAEREVSDIVYIGY